MTALKQAFEKLYSKHNSREALESDPLTMADRNFTHHDFEVLSFLVAGLSYGRVDQIQKSCAALWEHLARLGLPRGEGIAAFLKNSPSPALLRRALKGWRHRLNTSEDLVQILLRLAKVLGEDRSLCQAYQKSFAVEPREQIIGFSTRLRGEAALSKPRLRSEAWKGTGLDWFASSPLQGGTCKRLMMWLRWMIRQDEIDPGTWLKLQDPSLAPVSAARLFWPVDTHIFRWAAQNKLVARQAPSWKAVEEITGFFQGLCPEDPVRYDFALCHTGMQKLPQPVLNAQEWRADL